MSEFDITFSFEKTFNVKANNRDEAQEVATEELAEYIQANKDMMKVEIHHVEA